MKNPFRIFKLLLLIIFVSTSQARGQGFLISQVKTLEVRNALKSYGDIEGSPYYTDKYVNSTVYLKDGNYATIPLRFDLFQDQMEFVKDGKLNWLAKNDIKYIRYDTDMIFLSSADGDSTHISYYFLKDDGKIMLFYKKNVLFQPMVPPKGYADAIPQKFIPDKDQIYIKKENMPARKILTKKDLTSFFAEDAAALEFMKNNKVKADNIESLHKLISYINSK